jgi:hypothetical protein
MAALLAVRSLSGRLLPFHQGLGILRGNCHLHPDGLVEALALLLMPAQVLLAVYLKQRRADCDLMSAFHPFEPVAASFARRDAC